MSGFRCFVGLFGLSGAVFAICCGAVASTISTGSMTPPDDLALADLVAVDPLGYSCIADSDIDLAFHASGKGIRLPRTCLPDPCRAALTRVELASLIGRPPLPSEWGDYYSRYADHCRKEVVPFQGSAVGDDGIETAADFWRPLAGIYPVSAPIRRQLPDLPPSIRSGPGLVRVSPLPFNPGLPPSVGTDPDPKTDVPAEERPIPPVPLPGSLVLWLAAGGCLFLARRIRPMA